MIKISKEEIRKYNNSALHKNKYIITSSESNHACNQDSKEQQNNWKAKEKKLKLALKN